MYYDKRNKAALAELAPNTQKAARKWYDYLIENDIELLIYDARRTEAEQRANVNSGASQTMKSYHLVGQALDFVPASSNGKVDWGGYGRAEIKKAVAEAKRLGFTWGGDWSSFVDKPHLQYNYNGYGTDTKLATSTPASKPSVSSNDTHKIVYGDTLSEIAEKYKVSVSDLKKWNGLKSSAINAGDTLKVKKPTVATSSTSIVPYPGNALYKGADDMRAIDIQRIQRAVKAQVTSVYDAQTAKAVASYQKRHGLKEDGVVGPSTWAKMF